MTPTAMGATAVGFRKVRLPLASYYAVTVVVPLANGSGSTGRVFLEHMTFVLLAPPTLIALVALFCHAVQRAARALAPLARDEERVRNTQSVAMLNSAPVRLFDPPKDPPWND